MTAILKTDINNGMTLTQIVGPTIPDVWFLCLWALLDNCFRYTIDKGSFEGSTRLELDHITLAIKFPYSEPYDTMLPKIPEHYGIPDPVAPGYVEEYMSYLMTDEIKPNETYTYGSRIASQLQHTMDSLKSTPGSNQIILQVAQPNDWTLSDPPCLRHIDIRLRKGHVVFYPYFRSWDLWNGFPANLAGLAVLQKYIADGIGMEVGPMICSSKGLHIYKYVEELARIRTGNSPRNG